MTQQQFDIYMKEHGKQTELLEAIVGLLRSTPQMEIKPPEIDTKRLVSEEMERAQDSVYADPFTRHTVLKPAGGPNNPAEITKPLQTPKPMRRK